MKINIFNEFYTKNYKKLLNTLKTKIYYNTEDYLHNSYILIVNNIENLDIEKNLFNYIYTTTINQYYRDFNINKKYEIISISDIEYSENDYNLQDDLMSNINFNKIISILDKLDQKYPLEVLLFKYKFINQISYNKMSEMTKISSATIYYKIQKIIKLIKQNLQNEL